MWEKKKYQDELKEAEKIEEVKLDSTEDRIKKIRRGLRDREREDKVMIIL